MKRTISVILVSTVLIVLLYGCSKAVTEVSDKTTVTVNETTKATTEPTTELTTKQDVTITKMNTITTSASTKKATPTQSKVKTTKKVTTTQKQTTAKPYYCDEGGSHHRRNVGQIGWCSTSNEALNAISDYISSRGLDGKANYTISKCSCGLYTAYITETPTKKSPQRRNRQQASLIIVMRVEVIIG